MTSSPLARRSSWKPSLGRRNNGDGLPATKWVSDVPFIVIYPVVGWGCRLKPGFSVPAPARCERESCPERNPCPAHSDRWSLVEEGSTPVWAAAGWRGCRLGGGMWRVGCLPPNYQHLPIPYSPPFTRLPTGVGVWERRGAETARSGGVWWGTHLKWMEPHHRRCYMPSAPLLWRPVSSPCMHAGVLVGPGRERWAWRTAPARRLTGQDAGPYPWKHRGPKGGRSRW